MYWSDGAEVGFTLDQFDKQQDVVQAVKTIEFQGGKTNTADALRLLRTRVFQVSHERGILGWWGGGPRGEASHTGCQEHIVPGRQD